MRNIVVQSETLSRRLGEGTEENQLQLYVKKHLRFMILQAMQIFNWGVHTITSIRYVANMRGQLFQIRSFKKSPIYLYYLLRYVWFYF
jgi:hypothetical protein